MPDTNVISLLIQGGAVAIALVALYIIYKLVLAFNRMHAEQGESHRIALERNTDAWLKNTDAIAQLKDAINHQQR